MTSAGRYDRALAALNESYDLVEKNEMRGVAPEVLQIYADTYEAMGDYGNALKYHRRFKETHDSIFSEESQRRIEELQAGFEAAEKDREIVALRYRNELGLAELEQERTVRNALLGGAVLLLALVGVTGVSYRMQRKAHRNLRQAHDRLRTAHEALGLQKTEIEEALSQVKLLSGLLPMCSHCHKIRDDGGYWQQVEAYISKHSEAEVSHGLCPGCAKELYPEYIGESASVS
ncbi:MAG: hypothetical protein GY856_00200 [bacterium]|nr:hypothetical protein [bacterium]